MSTNLDKLAQLLNLPAAQVETLARNGTIPRAVDGAYDLALCANAYIKHLQGLANDPARQYKAELAREQLRAKRLANDAAEGLTLPVDEVVGLLGAALEQVRDALLGQAERLAQIAPETPHAVIAFVDAHNRATLERLAQTPLPEPCRAGLGGLDGAPATGRATRMDA